MGKQSLFLFVIAVSYFRTISKFEGDKVLVQVNDLN